ncbi:MAG: type I methionyl aminopeptidase [Gammaproteobacteria bacterium WSBS_2016_MAG_OTU1]
MSGKIPIKTLMDVEKMRIAGKLAAQTLDYITPFVTPGVSTGELDRLCHDFIVQNGAIPAPLHYTPRGHKPYPKSVCTSINHQVCHGVPDFERFLKDGDIVNIDVTVIKNGWHGDTARMFYAGNPSILAQRLCETTLECLKHGIEAVRPGMPLNHIGIAIQKHAESRGFSVVRDFCGHGLGCDFHELPQILHYNDNNATTPIMEENMVFTIEPMINAGKYGVKILSDGWTAVTRDRSLSAQWEHTVRVAEDGYEILTLSEKYSL